MAQLSHFCWRHTGGRKSGADAEEASNKSQAYFWAKRWQEVEREADEDIKTGRVRSFNSVEELIKDLE